MQRLALTLPTPAENLALDEALLDWAEFENRDWEFLRIWESPQPIVVAGRSTRVAIEVNLAACRERGFPILRRSSGGAAIVAGPGCLMYAVVLSYKLRPDLKDIGRAHRFVLGRLVDSLRSTLATESVQLAGTSDLVIEQSQQARQNALPRAFYKFSGNSLRAKRSHLLYHGTILYQFDLALIDACLRMPPRVPGYRGSRPHRDFVMNLPMDRQSLIDAIDLAWPTQGEVRDWPRNRTAQLVAERFGRDDWHLEYG